MALAGVVAEDAHAQRRPVHLGGDPAAAELEVPGDALAHREQERAAPQRFVEAARPAGLRGGARSPQVKTIGLAVSVVNLLIWAGITYWFFAHFAELHGK